MNKAPRPNFLDPLEFDPPRNEKIILLTKMGTCVVGMWSDSGCDAWLPLPNTPEHIKKRRKYANAAANTGSSVHSSEPTYDLVEIAFRDKYGLDNSEKHSGFPEVDKVGIQHHFIIPYIQP